MSDIQHAPECLLKRRLLGVYDMCYCNLEQRLRNEIKRLREAIEKHKSETDQWEPDMLHEIDKELYEALDEPKD